MVGGTPNLLVVTPSVPVSDLKGFVDYAKQNPEKLNYGTGGIGLLNHLALEQFRAAAGIEQVTYGHYRGIGPAFKDMLGNQIQVLMPGLAAALPHLRNGKVRPLAITGLQRHPLAPEVPTFEELGYKGFDGVQWYGIVGPARMPAEVTQRLNAEINKAITSPALQQRLAAEALTVMPMSPEQFGAYMQAEIAKYSALAKARNIRLDD
jgi:tripartite-type tricarboxylate transporter receptor subunit TctC